MIECNIKKTVYYPSIMLAYIMLAYNISLVLYFASIDEMKIFF